MEKIYLKKSVEYVVGELESLWNHRGLKFKIDMPSEAILNLPHEAYERVLRILIENSINHSLKNATINIHCRQGVLTITNPISTDKNKIIDSTGKGLEIAKTLCEYYKWELDAASENGKYKIILKLI
jgi:signal transduction histidine kinase